MSLDEIFDKMHHETVEHLKEYTPDKNPSVLPLVPEKCLFCGEKWKGGVQVPGKPFPRVGRRVFYDCGSSLSVWCDLGDGAVHLLAKNCNKANDCDKSLRQTFLGES